MKTWKLITIFLCCVSLVACATTFDKKGRVHHVRRGDTLWTVADFYKVDAQKLAELNGIEDPAQVQVGSALQIPPRNEPEFKLLSGEKKKEKKKKTAAAPVVAGQDRKIESDHGRFMWPVPGALISPFGMRSGRRHDGIDIKANVGDPVKAADSGRVVFVGTMRGYGNLILLRHKDDFFTAYAHNNKNLVKKDQDVKSGQVIAKAGQTGRATGPHLHFEVRKGQHARNPLFFLPKRNVEKSK